MQITMQTVAPMLGILLALAVYGVVLWIAWKFYCAFARIGEELSEIKTVLRQREVASPPSPPSATP